MHEHTWSLERCEGRREAGLSGTGSLSLCLIYEHGILYVLFVHGKKQAQVGRDHQDKSFMVVTFQKEPQPERCGLR